MFEIFADGSSLGNPGKAGIGIAVYRDKKLIKKISKYIGQTTNNVAEYTALICALQEALGKNYKSACFYLDSELVVKQMTGLYKVKNQNLYAFNVIARNLVDIMGGCNIYYKPRQENTVADKLAKDAAGSGGR